VSLWSATCLSVFSLFGSVVRPSAFFTPHCAESGWAVLCVIRCSCAGANATIVFRLVPSAVRGSEGRIELSFVSVRVRACSQLSSMSVLCPLFPDLPLYVPLCFACVLLSKTHPVPSAGFILVFFLPVLICTAELVGASVPVFVQGKVKPLL
jgi:hypothetical protein